MDYDFQLAHELHLGFSVGFRIHYDGELVTTVFKILTSALSMPDIVAEKIQRLIKDNKIDGPYEQVPLQQLWCHNRLIHLMSQIHFIL